jgi:hypothetical protein
MVIHVKVETLLEKMENFAELRNGSYVCPQTQHVSHTHKFIRPMPKISSESLNYNNLEFRLNSPVEIRKPGSLEEGEGPEPEPKERTLTVLKLTDGLGLTEAGIKVSEDTDWNRHRAAAAGRGIMRRLLDMRRF